MIISNSQIKSCISHIAAYYPKLHSRFYSLCGDHFNLGISEFLSHNPSYHLLPEEEIDKRLQQILLEIKSTD